MPELTIKGMRNNMLEFQLYIRMTSAVTGTGLADTLTSYSETV
jgi:hypothetical protein